MTLDIAIWRDGRRQVLRIARPEKKNALTGAMYRALCDAIEAGDADSAIAAHIMIGIEWRLHGRQRSRRFSCDVPRHR